MDKNINSKLLNLAWIAAIVGLFITVLATRNRESPYAPLGPFVGCYSNGVDRLLLRPNGRLNVNGTAVGAYRILKPVGGKHGYLVEAQGLTLTGGKGALIKGTRGTGGFQWPISDDALNITFAPDVGTTLNRMSSTSC